MKVLKFPKEKTTKPRWIMWVRNADKRQMFNKVLSFLSLTTGILIILYVIYTLNKP